MQHIGSTSHAAAVSISSDAAVEQAAWRALRSRAGTDEGAVVEADKKVESNHLSILYNAESKNSKEHTNWTRWPWAEGAVRGACTA